MLTKMCIAAANYIIEKTNEFNEGKPYGEQIVMTGKRLQKLLYFSDVQYMITHNGRSMFSDEYYAWPSGPVIPSIYHKYRHFQNGLMSPLESNSHANLSNDIKDTISFVLNSTNKMDTSRLVELSHAKRGPWEKNFNENSQNYYQIIPKKDIYDFYRNIVKKQGCFLNG